MRQIPLILIIDDEPNLLDIALTRLKGSGFEVEVAHDASEGRDIAREIRPDLILLDINMPEINGTEALLDFKKDPLFKDTKIAFLTNMVIPWPGVTSENESFAKELGAVRYLDKAKDMDMLDKIVKEILKS